MTTKTLIFEPWSLGDALIAAAVIREKPEAYDLICHSRWHPILSHALGSSGTINLIAADLSYTERSRFSPFRLELKEAQRKAVSDLNTVNTRVLSIRGDFRDWIAARRLLSKTQLKMTGWTSFFSRRLRLFDLPFHRGWKKVWNRYEAWCELTDIPFSVLQETYRSRLRRPASIAQVSIHIGAQWRSKQYPKVAELVEGLKRKGIQVLVLAGPKDTLPPNMCESDVRRVMDAELIMLLQGSDRVITNDSGPMHLAALLGCSTLALARTSNLAEWLPPGVDALTSPRMPHGYRPDPEYCSDNILDDWPAAEEVFHWLEQGSET